MLEKREYLDLPLFKGMNLQEIEAALSCVGAYRKKYRKEEFIFLEMAKVTCVGCVLKGAIAMIREDIWGNRTLLLTIGTQELFGENFACGSKNLTSVSFVAKEETEVLFLPFHRVMYSCSNACSHHQKLMFQMVRLMAEKNAALMLKVDIISKKTLREKISTFLFLEAGKNQSQYFTIAMGRIQMAEYLNVDRSALSRELKRLKEEGYIDFEKNTFRILKEF